MRPALLSRPRAATVACRAPRLLLIHLIITLAFSAMAGAQGFGFFKTEGRITRWRPPEVYLPAASLIAQVESPHANARPILPRLRDGIERALNAPNRQTLTPASTVRELLLTCTITRFSVTSRTETRTRSEYKKTGEHTVTDPITHTAAELTEFLNRARALEVARRQALLAQGKAPAADNPVTAVTPPAPPVATPGPPRAPLYKGVGKLTNKVIVEWVKAGIPEDEILTNITQSRSNDFDVSTGELARLHQAGVGAQVLLAMQSPRMPRPPGRAGRRVFGAIILVWQFLPYLLIL